MRYAPRVHYPWCVTSRLIRPALAWLTILVLPLEASGRRIAACAEEGGTPQCVHSAYASPQDAGAQAIYEGLRLGLERARLARICQHPWGNAAEDLAWAKAWRTRLDAAAPGPLLFVVGDDAALRLKGGLQDVPGVHVLTRYAVEGRVLGPPARAASRRRVVCGLVDVAAVRLVLERLCSKSGARVLWHGSGSKDSARAFLKHAGLRIQDDSEGPADAILHMRLGPEARPPYAEALRLARSRKIPLVSDDRARFGQGACVVILPAHDLVGRVAADIGRRLMLRPRAKTRAPPANPVDAPQRVQRVTALRTWVDLDAADRLGVRLPSALLAYADRLRRSSQPEATRK